MEHSFESCFLKDVGTIFNAFCTQHKIAEGTIVLFEGVCENSRHPKTPARGWFGGVCSAAPDTVSGESAESRESAESGESADEFQNRRSV